MSISELTLKTNDDEPVRRFEVFTGSGRRREWSDELKAQIVAESYEPGMTVCSSASTSRSNLRSIAIEFSSWRSSASSIVTRPFISSDHREQAKAISPQRSVSKP